ncbi:F-box only protein 42-like [Temnothorax curvispinosus]|uniref:F-box only protein 42-like n=1 Tax=Temnothorax curvispinosus TaxID=300111 RepID=A0A6J1R0L7_9HYME|nr:F-box only protein 42-like [Temnothorax curvispinosus]XP_024888524.1 F-box only protein 42-like [Temnothorax curvispinosus]
MQCKINDLPDELLEYILSLIPPYRDLQECRLVCKRWYRATKNVIEHNEAHFQKSVAFGSLLWNSLPSMHWISTIGKRHSHSACIYDNSMYVFGGCTATWTTFNDLWQLDLGTRTWVRPITMGNYPSPKACATMLYYKKSLILFGGWSHPSPYPLHQQWKLFNELHVYSIKSNKWTAINTLETPPPTSAHSATIHRNLMVVFGGVCNGYNSSNDVWCLNLDSYTWHKQSTSNLKPQPRYGQSQIELGEKHLLVLGGCTGPNAAMNDAWLLTMEGVSWTWRKINMHNTEWAPTHIWCHQACKVGNYIIVLSKNRRQTKPSDMSISLKKVACQRSTSSRLCESNLLPERQGSVSTVDKDENINGRHGAFSRSHSQNAHASSQASSIPKTIPFYSDNTLSMAAFRDQPLRGNSNTNRQRQLESLRRMEEKIRNKKTQLTKVSKKAENTLSIFVLDITNVLSDDCNALWIPLKQNDHSGPDERILYSLVMGRGELIVFGGIRKEHTTLGHTEVDDSVVYNDLHFINPPRYVI